MTMRSSSSRNAAPATQSGPQFLAYPRSPWDVRLWQVMHCRLPSADADTLCAVDDFGTLVVTHRRDPATLEGMGFSRVQA